MSNFPLYDSLSQKLPKKNLTVKQKNEFTARIQTFDTAGHELLYALIRFYQLQNEKEAASLALPYGGEFMKGDMVFDVAKLPRQLQQLLYRFAEAHEKSMEETQRLDEERSGV